MVSDIPNKELLVSSTGELVLYLADENDEGEVMICKKCHANLSRETPKIPTNSDFYNDLIGTAELGVTRLVVLDIDLDIVLEVLVCDLHNVLCVLIDRTDFCRTIVFF